MPRKKKEATPEKSSPSKKTAKKEKKPAEEEGQPEVNIGLFGHVDHGKTTLTEQLTGKWTDTHSEEMKRGITIRLGYADVIFRKITGAKDPYQYTTKEKDEKGNPTEFVRKVSFVDAPGHESLMATMLSGATIIDGALLLVAANEKCPQPQTREHLMALQIAGIKKVVIVQNKIDLLSKERLLRNYEEIREFLKDTDYAEAPIVPLSAQRGVNIDLLIHTIQSTIPTPTRDSTASPMMFIARSFDINKPGTLSEDMRGGILGGAIVQGKLKKGDIIEIKPGRVVNEQNQMVAKPYTTTIAGIITGGKQVDEAMPGGNLAIMTTLDPSVVKSDSLTGSVVGIPGKLPPLWHNLRLDVHLLERVVGALEEQQVEPIKQNEVLMLNVNASATIGTVTELGKQNVQCKLKLPVCAKVGSKVTISRRIGTRFRLIGYGLIQEEQK